MKKNAAGFLAMMMAVGVLTCGWGSVRAFAAATSSEDAESTSKSESAEEFEGAIGYGDDWGIRNLEAPEDNDDIIADVQRIDNFINCTYDGWGDDYASVQIYALGEGKSVGDGMNTDWDPNLAYADDGWTAETVMHGEVECLEVPTNDTMEDIPAKFIGEFEKDGHSFHYALQIRKAGDAEIADHLMEQVYDNIVFFD